ncbi:hypothetical protein [Shumkonia mesophila]|uniref:hypothetical protein n=1 Tax=Shumkonia mesophila TaxID=2838854 RepID=UPI00293450E9|nr:hypothetical protein [Shumkonia mesophila]
MAYRKRSLPEFLDDPASKSEDVVYRHSRDTRVKAYVRKGQKFIGEVEFPKVLCLVKVVAERKSDILFPETFAEALQIIKSHTYDPTKSGLFLRGTGGYRAFDALMLEESAMRGYDAIFVEDVANPAFPDILLRYGYRLSPGIFPSTSPSFWKPLRLTHSHAVAA